MTTNTDHNGQSFYRLPNGNVANKRYLDGNLSLSERAISQSEVDAVHMAMGEGIRITVEDHAYGLINGTWEIVAVDVPIGVNASYKVEWTLRRVGKRWFAAQGQPAQHDLDPGLLRGRVAPRRSRHHPLIYHPVTA